jgi:hypothetical protein
MEKVVSKLPNRNRQAKVAKPPRSRTSPTKARSVAPGTYSRVALKRHLKEQAFELQDWYSSEDAKRRFGSICQAVNEEGREIELLGIEDRPLLSLVDASRVPKEKNEVEISIDEAKVDWSAVTAAALFFGTVFRIRGKRVVRAVLRRHPINRHSALKYRRPQIEDMGQTLSTFIEDFARVSKHFDETTELIQKRFKEVWRSQNLTVPQ